MKDDKIKTILLILGLGAMMIVTSASGPAAPKAWGQNFSTAAQQGSGPKTGWASFGNTKTRLVAGSPALPALLLPKGIKDTRLAGLHIKLEPKWKTYWRSPGDSGVPPSFDWSGSENVKKVEVFWPAPNRYVERFDDFTVNVVGYKKEVLLPLNVQVEDHSKPAILRLKLFFGVCEVVCVPVNASLQTLLPPVQMRGSAGTPSAAHDSLIVYYYNKVPKLLSLQDQAGLHIKKISVIKTASGESLAIDAAFPKGTKRRDLFVETPPGIFLPPPVQAKSANTGNDAMRYLIDLSKSGGAKVILGKKLKLTMVSDKAQGQIEQIVK